MILLRYKNREVELRPTKIICLAQNYRAHAQEMGASVPREPKIFLKPPSSLLGNNGVVFLPKMSARVDYEVELAVVMKDRCRDILYRDAEKSILGYTVIVDVTARDIQEEAKKAGMPWTVAKGFDTFAPIGPKLIPVERIDVGSLDIWLKVNGEYRQQSNTKNMIFSVQELVVYISRIMTLEPMDIIATGTPEGVGPMKGGDWIEAGIEDIGVLRFRAKQEG